MCVGPSTATKQTNGTAAATSSSSRPLNGGGHNKNVTGSSHPPFPAITKPYRVKVTLRFCVLSLGLSILLAFSAGRIARIVMLKQHQSLSMVPSSNNSISTTLSTKAEEDRDAAAAAATCQQLVVDMDGVATEFLDSEERLSSALVSVATQSSSRITRSNY